MEDRYTSDVKQPAAPQRKLTGRLCSAACWGSCDLKGWKTKHSMLTSLSLLRVFEVLLFLYWWQNVHLLKEILISWNSLDNVNVTELLHSHLDIDHQVIFNKCLTKNTNLNSVKSGRWRKSNYSKYFSHSFCIFMSNVILNKVASTQTAGWGRAWRRRASAPLLTKQHSAECNFHLLLSLFRTITN